MSDSTSRISREEFHDLLTFDAGVEGYPCKFDLILRDNVDVLVYADRRKNANSEWTIRSYRVLGDRITFRTEDVDRAHVAAILVEEFDPNALTTDERYVNQRPVRYGVPTAVAVDGTPAVCAWLYVRGETREEIADLMDVGRPTVGEYLSRFRRRGTGIPDDLDVPAVGELVPEVPPEFDPEEDQQIVADGGVRVGTFDDLRGGVERPIDRNPSFPCEICGEKYNWLDYWKGRVLDGDGDPIKASMWCDECEEEIQTLRRRLSDNATLFEWGESA